MICRHRRMEKRLCMNTIAIAQETLRIIRERSYSAGGGTVSLPDADFSAVEVISPAAGDALLQAPLPAPDPAHICRIAVTREDSFEAASRFVKPFVLNFANAHHAGGGFKQGAHAQEESLCRCSTLYASISSEAAKEMYRCNNLHPMPLESHYMLYSPQVCVFRRSTGELLPVPFPVSVMTAAAPNRNGLAILSSKKSITDAVLHRIRVMLRVAQAHGCRTLILGAWGCGAFRNPPDLVAGAFRTALIDEQMQAYFDDVVFAVYCRSRDRNFSAFAEAFGIDVSD